MSARPCGVDRAALIPATVMIVVAASSMCARARVVKFAAISVSHAMRAAVMPVVLVQLVAWAPRAAAQMRARPTAVVAVVAVARGAGRAVQVLWGRRVTVQAMRRAVGARESGLSPRLVDRTVVRPMTAKPMMRWAPSCRVRVGGGAVSCCAFIAVVVEPSRIGFDTPCRIGCVVFGGACAVPLILSRGGACCAVGSAPFGLPFGNGLLSDSSIGRVVRLFRVTALFLGGFSVDEVGAWLWLGNCCYGGGGGVRVVDGWAAVEFCAVGAGVGAGGGLGDGLGGVAVAASFLASGTGDGGGGGGVVRSDVGGGA